MEWVVKIGGSLFPHYSINLAQELLGEDVLIICGGGQLANQIREYHHELNFSPTASHKTAILCMDILGMLLADKVKGAEAVRSLEKAKKVLNEGKLPVLIPSMILEYLDPLEHSWRVTSDSISLYLSDLLDAKLLITTDVDGIYTHRPSMDGAQFIKEISAKKLLNFGETSLDESFAELLLKYKTSTYVVNGKHPERVLAILDGRSSINTFIGGD
ncbi:delta 1-pyrroline-5-carboxylate synthetase [Methanobacterium formicicum]|uniref:Aspartate/glutamate/uridylate kinase n=1 Tax=Methanobacterium formicicum (strain DSM 3637 / PP1) TaxID=1204725 RepID=K2QZU4_METFP|nr:delta 1-pyrroline-5-carboxylate synthetase [Methanobacterium formicicum]EKF85803.1 aspartate/glutamate/uridylate kinase [Methanobacterium formicicum DSM 3637]